MKRIMLLGAFFCLGLSNAFALNNNVFDDQEVSNLVVDFSTLVTQSNVMISVLNDDSHPWSMEDDVAVIRGNDEPDYYSSSWLTLTFNTTEKTELSFEWASYNYGSHFYGLQLYIDGEYDSFATSSSFQSKRFLLEAGKHIIAFRDTVSNYNYNQNWSGIRNVKVNQVNPLNTVVLTENSMPLTFLNDSKLPWIIDDGFIRSGNNYGDNTVSRFSTTFTIDKTSRLSYQVLIPYDGRSYYDGKYRSDHSLYIDINGWQWDCWESESDWTTDMFVLEPGTYTITWTDTIRGYSNLFDCKSKIRNIELISDWVDVELDMPGTLGVEVLYKVNVLNDVNMLKIRGAMNATDWENIHQMTNLAALDLSDAIFDAVPDFAFDGMTWLGNVVLPEGMKAIGKCAFRETRLLGMDIPSTVIMIDNGAFQNCSKLRAVNLPDNLESIGAAAFDLCSSIERIEMPNTVSSVGPWAFSGCSVLRSIIFSDALTEISEWVCRDCYSLENVHFPVDLTSINYEAFINNTNLHHIDLPNSLNMIVCRAFYNCGLDSVSLPAKLSYLGEDAFRYCNNLKFIVFPSYIERKDYRYVYYGWCVDGNYDLSWNNGKSGYYSNFDNCPSLQTIVMRSATPPIIDNDPFVNSRDKSEIILKVPSFAVANYKLDQYWYQFGQIVEGDDVDYWKITSLLSLTNNRRMQGKPDVDLYYDGQFLLGGNAPMEMGQFDLYQNQSNPGRMLNNCDAVSADSVSTQWEVEANKWYFITPFHDVELSKIELTTEASYVFRYYDGNSRAQSGVGNSWRNVEDTKLFAGQGYIFHCNTATTLKMPANTDCHVQVFNTADVTKILSVFESETQADKNWNYVGNPYSCYYDIFYMDFTAPITVWTGSTYKAYSIVDDDYVLSPMQAFFVQKPDEVDNIVFHKEGRQLTSEISRASYSGSRSSIRNNRYLFDIKIQSNEMFDETRVVINDAASTGYEIERDASKFMSFESDVPQICTVDGDNSYAINERPLGDGLAKVAYYAASSGMMTISASRSDGKVILYDEIDNKAVNLTEQDYTFYSDATSGLNTSRFRLLFSSADATGVVSSFVNGIEVVSVQDAGISVSAANGTEIFVYDLEGIKVFEGIADDGQTLIPLPAGRYVVKVNSESTLILIQ